MLKSVNFQQVFIEISRPRIDPRRPFLGFQSFVDFFGFWYFDFKMEAENEEVNSKMKDYEMIEQIGRGAFGTTFLVIHKTEQKK